MTSLPTRTLVEMADTQLQRIDRKLNAHIKETRERFKSQDKAREAIEKRLQALEDACKVVEEIKLVLYGDNSNPTATGMRTMVNEALSIARSTEAQRKKDREAEQESADMILNEVQKLKLTGASHKGAWGVVKDIGTVVLVLCAVLTGLLELGKALQLWK